MDLSFYFHLSNEVIIYLYPLGYYYTLVLGFYFSLKHCQFFSCYTTLNVPASFDPEYYPRVCLKISAGCIQTGHKDFIPLKVGEILGQACCLGIWNWLYQLTFLIEGTSTIFTSSKYSSLSLNKPLLFVFLFLHIDYTRFFWSRSFSLGVFENFMCSISKLYISILYPLC